MNKADEQAGQGPDKTSEVLPVDRMAGAGRFEAKNPTLAAEALCPEMVSVEPTPITRLEDYRSEAEIKRAVMELADLQTALDGLSARYRFLLSEIVYQGRTDDEMAHRLGVAPQAVQTELVDALTHLYLKLLNTDRLVHAGHTRRLR